MRGCPLQLCAQRGFGEKEDLQLCAQRGFGEKEDLQLCAQRPAAVCTTLRTKGSAAECADQNCRFSCKELNKTQFCGRNPHTGD